MAFQQYFVQEWKSIPAQATDSEKTSACFDCNICLDFASDPVVTLCGHLYCWPCIYKWFELQSTSLATDELPRCPVCKADISEKTMIPLYGRGLSLAETKHEGNDVPPRPPACGLQGLTDSSQNPHNIPNPYINSSESMVFPQSVGMYGEMVYARVFGNSQSLYTYPNSYHSVGSSSPRFRRLELQADKSLHRVTIFLFCCFLLCLLTF